MSFQSVHRYGQGSRGSGGSGREGRGAVRGGRGGGRGAASRGGPGGRGGGANRGSSSSQTFSTSGGALLPAVPVTDIEDALEKASKDTPNLSQLSMATAFPNRPGYGTRGTPVVLWANYVNLVIAPDITLFRYDISASPQVAGKKLSQIVRLLLETPDLAGTNLVTGFKSTLISRQRLPQDEMVIFIQYRLEGEDEPRKDAVSYTVRIQYTNTLTIGELTEYVTSTDLSARSDNKSSITQALNIFLNHYSKANENLIAIGAKTFSLNQDSATWDLGGSLAAMKGFFASVRAATNRILVNVNVSHGTFYKTGQLDHLIMVLDARNKYRIETFVKKVRVRTTHLSEKRNRRGDVIPRVKTIFGLATPNDGHSLAHPPRVKDLGAGPKDVEFWLEGASPVIKPKEGKGKKKSSSASGPPRSGQYISVYDFFLKAYGKRLANPDISVVNVGTRETPTYLPPEVCVVLPGQVARSKLDPGQTQQMIKFAVRKPGENLKSIIEQGLETTGLCTQTNVLLEQFGISSTPELITVWGRVLVEPKIMYKLNKSASVRFGSWNMSDVKFSAPGSLKKWSYLLVSMGGREIFNPTTLGEVIKKVKNALDATGVVTTAPLSGQRVVLNSPEDAQPLSGQRVVLNSPEDAQLDERLAAAAKSLDLLFVILPESNTSIYNRIKHCGDVKYGIHTICTVGYKLAKERGQDQYLSNVALKFNLKLGGCNQLIDPSRLGLINENKTMIVGIDVTHPSPGSSSQAPSIAGMVASVDKWLGQWPAILRIQSTARQEMVSDLVEMLKTRLHLWRSRGKHQALPENIIVYRDGVSEGQYQTVLDNELPLLRRACEETYPIPDQKKGIPRFTIVIVGKRHHTRFYPTSEANADRTSNPKPGTIVDRGVTEARNWDFFLQAHAALQGTARPAHYYVVIDEVFRHRYKTTIPPPYKNVADILEDVTQSMCYSYGRATKAVSICTPAYYADILCERARCYLSGVFDSPTQSAAPSVAGSAPVPLGNGELKTHEKLKDSMFYI